jgi:hypothetical protein
MSRAMILGMVLALLAGCGGHHPHGAREVPVEHHDHEDPHGHSGPTTKIPMH